MGSSAVPQVLPALGDADLCGLTQEMGHPGGVVETRRKASTTTGLPERL